MIKTAMPPVHVRRLDIRQWLTAMNLPFGKPITVQFVDDLTPSADISFCSKGEK
jgi:hypothetical protein